MGIEKKVTCLNRHDGKCIITNQNCTPDYNLEHHPNNLDCTNYKEIVLYQFYVHPK